MSPAARIALAHVLEEAKRLVLLPFTTRAEMQAYLRGYADGARFTLQLKRELEQ
jgi:hypothetical protein